MKTQPVLVTGGAGYIGSHTCKALAAAGFFPISIDNVVYGHEWAAKWGPLLKADINDRDLLEHAFRIYRPVAVLHFAAFAFIDESGNSPDKYYRNNVVGTLTLPDVMLKHGCNKLIFSSTCATCGTPRTLPITEAHEQKPINPYGWSKLMIEQIMRDYHRACNLRQISLRYFNGAGADPDGELGEDHDPETHLIPIAIQAALGEHPYVEIYGTDYPTTDGTAVRDYIHMSVSPRVDPCSRTETLAERKQPCLPERRYRAGILRPRSNESRRISDHARSATRESPRRPKRPAGSRWCLREYGVSSA